ncbi:putative lysozyme [Salmonella phage 36]|uniref:Lysozyme n=1 Tax=Salmonella phage 36 TaxID=1654889 RepID=A0A0N7CF00_9CAUD|nr:putative lysozyme [Salmonella phage 36]AKJ74054.1 putative lysozyme [Salmonella phage 36]
MKVAADAVDKAVKVDIPISMRAALYSFTFNAGTGAFRKINHVEEDQQW